MKKIPLWRQEKPYTKSVIIDYTLVDDEDYEMLNKYRWSCSRRHPRTRADGKWLSMHRLIMGLENGDKKLIDHRDRNPLNNQKENLRICPSLACNLGNSWNKNNSSGYKGVTREGNRWRAQIGINGKTRYIGSYDTKEDAALAYNEKAKELWGEFALLNEIK
jgi:hypothetical protein